MMKSIFAVIAMIMPLLAMASMFVMLAIPMQITRSSFQDNYGPLRGYSFLVPSLALQKWWGTNFVNLTGFFVWFALIFAVLFTLIYLVHFIDSIRDKRKFSFSFGVFIILCSLVWAIIYMVGGIIAIVKCIKEYYPQTYAYTALFAPTTTLILYIIFYYLGYEEEVVEEPVNNSSKNIDIK